MLSEEQKTVLNLTNDINRLTEQRDVLQAQVNKLALQHDEFYAKRSEAAKEFELKLQETRGIDEKIKASRYELEQKKKEIEKRERDLVIKEQKLSADKAAFRAEKMVFEGAHREFDLKVKELDRREAGIAEKEKKIEDREEAVYVKEHSPETIEIIPEEVTEKPKKSKKGENMKKVLSLTVIAILVLCGQAFAFNGRKTVTAAGTAEAISSSDYKYALTTICAETDNTGVIAVGNVGVVATLATRTGIPLDASDCYTLSSPSTNGESLSSIYIDATVSGDGVTFQYV